MEKNVSEQKYFPVNVNIMIASGPASSFNIRNGMEKSENCTQMLNQMYSFYRANKKNPTATT